MAIKYNIIITAKIIKWIHKNQKNLLNKLNKKTNKIKLKK